jgi:ABC-type Zn2+ transport system substrate-binding protein/surface adhesin/cytochrome oxidase Cu insertion factor (SCO1/SenC/PrrC family)
MRRILQPLVALLLFSFVLPAWAGNVPRVLVSIKPVHSIVTGIMKGVGQPHLIVEGDAVPYDYTLSDGQQEALSTADMVVWTGAELEPFLVTPLAQLGDSSIVLELLNNSNLKVLPSRGQDDARDPFLWLDTRNALILVTELTNAITAFDPDNSKHYQSNSAKLLEEISDLDREFEYGYRSVRAGRIFLYHDTLQYFEQAYGTRVVGTLSSKLGGTPDVKAFLEARTRIDDTNAAVDCVLTEAGMSTDNLAALISDSRIKVVEIDSFGTRFEPGPGLYTAMMRANFNAIKGCFEKGGNDVKLDDNLTKELPGSENEILPSKIRGKYILQDHLGKTIRDSEYRDSFQLITFGYISCPDICPTTLQIITGAMKRLGDRGKLVQPLFITVDPRRDTVEVLNQYVGYFYPRLVGLTGTQAMIDRVTSQFKVRVEKEYPDDAIREVYTVNHTAGTYLIAPGGQFLKKFAYGTTSVDMAKDITHFLNQL